MTVEEYYQGLKSPQKEICFELREIIKTKFPEFKESMLWGVPVFEEGLVYIVSLKNHVNLGFTISGLSKEEEKLFQGGGKTTKKIEIRSLDEINEGEIEKLLNFTINKNNEKLEGKF